MDVNSLRIAVTVLSFAVFIGIVVWALSRRNAAGFAEAAQLPFMDEAPRAERWAAPGVTTGPTSWTSPARIPAGDRPMYSSGEGLKS